MARLEVLFVLLCLVVAATGFSVSRSPALAATPTVAAARQRVSPLYAQEEGEEEDAAPEEDEEEEEKSLPSESTSDILNSPAFLKRKIDVLKSDIAKAEEDLEEIKAKVEAGKAEWGQQLDDLQTEFKNIQDRMTEQNKGGDDEATLQVARKVLDVVDNYQRAFGVVTAETDSEKAIEEAYKDSYTKIMEAFETLGIKEVETVGKEFDYEVHQAVMQVPSEYDEGIVCEELAKGYVINEKLIRAAMVSVSA